MVKNNEIDEIESKLTNRFCTSYATYGNDNVYLTCYYKDFAQRIEDFEVYDTDVYVVTFPKSGTTWTQEMVWLICNDLDYEGAKTYLPERFPFLEVTSLFDLEEMVKEELASKALCDSIKYSQELKHPRLIKTHLPYSLLPSQIRNGIKKPKMIYVTRNPKDVCTSYYYHTKLLPLGTTATLEEFTKLFLADKVLYAPFWTHILEFWEHRNDPNVLIINYEDMKKDLPAVIKEVAQFLGKAFTEDQLSKLAKHLSFDSMKKNSAVNYSKSDDMKARKSLRTYDGEFMRSGTVGQYKQELSAETINKIDEWTKKNIQGTDFATQYNYQ